MTRTAILPLAFALLLPGFAQAQVPATQAVMQEAARQGVSATTQAIQQQVERVRAEAAARDAAKKATEAAPNAKDMAWQRSRQ